MAIVFWDVDTQVDFMRPDGKLYVPGAVEIAPALAELTRASRRPGIVRVASVCDHVLEDDEISDTPDFRSTFPPHCLRGTPGQAKVPETALGDPLVVPNRPEDPALLATRLARHAGEVLIEKNHFDVFTNPNTSAVLDALAPDTVVVYGVAQDVCDAHAIAGFLKRGGLRVVFVEDAARAIDPARGAALLAEWKAQGVQVMRTAEVLAAFR
ncbi:MAG TPA: isochorismatase family protein [Vicinamibacteria bacterium]|nr:isochorismatase family protein [Vicinamibacteria bacterium]